MYSAEAGLSFAVFLPTYPSRRLRFLGIEHAATVDTKTANRYRLCDNGVGAIPQIKR